MADISNQVIKNEEHIMKEVLAASNKMSIAINEQVGARLNLFEMSYIEK